jgi:DNA primase
LPGAPARQCRSPFREDKKPSFSVYLSSGWERWYDHGEDCGGDVVDFWARAKEISVSEAIDQLSAMTGRSPEPPKGGTYKLASIEWPADLRSPTELECHSLAMLRGLLPGAFECAGKLGFLKVGTHRGELLWFLTDASKKGAEGKTFTGEPCLASGKKSVALNGTGKGWAYGLISDRPEWDAMKKIVLCEGTPDFFACVSLAIDSPINFRPVAMLGAGCRLGEETASHFRDNEVLIIPHNDEEGQAAAEKWKVHLREFETSKRMVQRLPNGCKDINEFIIKHPEDFSLLKGFSE